MSMETDTFSPEFRNGLIILLVAQFLSAWMGAYTEDTHAMYGANWTENLFYMHFLCLPLFLPLAGTLREQYARLATSTQFKEPIVDDASRTLGTSQVHTRSTQILESVLENVPQGIFFLMVNTMTQIVCISGVNLLSAKSSAVTVTIVLNIRKLVSFILSTILFGHELSGKMILGSTIVFGSGALYGYETSWRLPRQRKRHAELNGSVQKS